MSRHECTSESEILEAIATGGWPAVASPDLREHLTRCAGCRELSEVASMLRTDFQAAQNETDVPSAGLVWWRTQLRMRREAAVVTRRLSVSVEAAVLLLVLGAAAAVLVPISLVNDGVMIRMWDIVRGVLPWAGALAGLVLVAALVPVMALRDR